jgi:hypothetical protein
MARRPGADRVSWLFVFAAQSSVDALKLGAFAATVLRPRS